MLQTKLHRPPITQEHVYRSNLIESLEQNKHKPLTLVSAGAGFGKSMLISSWLEKSNVPYA
jgi:LuxR family maltose regulon positive regulatory protein